MKSTPSEEIYTPEFVESLFNRMSTTYGITNYLSSFGFTERWRKQCVQALDWTKNVNSGCDLMSGMGETWGLIMAQTKRPIQLLALDFSPSMNQKSRAKLLQYPQWAIEIREEDVLQNSIASNSADFIVSSFGLKTFSKAQLEKLAEEINRILKPGASFSLIEISKPKGILLRRFYLFYLNRIIPIIGRLFMGNSQDYQMLGQYCERFEDCSTFKMLLEARGLKVEFKSYFYGCATGVVGSKPI